MKKPFLSFLLIFLPMLASAEPVEIDGIWYNINGNCAEVTSGSQYSGVIAIPEIVNYEGVSYNVTSIGKYAFNSCIKLTSISIPNSVTTISDYAFKDCSGLTFVSIPNSVTSIGYKAFMYCSALTSVSIPNSMTSIGNYVFDHCSGLSSVTIPNSVTSIGSGVFSYCSCLTSVTIPNSVTSIGNNAFYGCSGLTSVAIPNSVTSIGNYAFSGCSGLISVTISNSVTSIGDSAFEGCIGLASITIPNGVTSIGDDAFYGCSGLTSVTIPNSVLSIGRYAFWECSHITDVYCSADNVPNTDDNAFKYSNIEHITLHVPAGSIDAYNAVVPWKNFKEIVAISDPIEIDGIWYKLYSTEKIAEVTRNQLIKNKKYTGSIEIPSTLNYDDVVYTVTKIGKDAFNGSNDLTSVTIPNSVTSIGFGAFEHCNALTSITIPNSVKRIESYAFYYCTGLTSVTIPSSLENINQRAFGKCYELVDVFCKAEKVSSNINEEGLYTHVWAFEDNGLEEDIKKQITLHVPAASIEAYDAVEPWKYFKEIVALADGDIPETSPKCAKPEISYANGKITLSCETEGVEFISKVLVEDAKDYNDAEFTLSQTYKISVYATKDGYENSDVVTREIVIGNGQSMLFGDLNKDGKVNVADHVKLSEIILNK